MQELEFKIENWKNKLLDLGKRNRLINFRETKRSNISITVPECNELYKGIVQDEKQLSFSMPLKITYDENGEEEKVVVQYGDIKTNQTLNEQQKTLKALRNKAKISIEERGINSLYLTFGLIKWKERYDSDIIISSPIILVPVSLTIESITEPYKIELHEDEIVINPSLSFKFENDYGIVLPEFDGADEEISNYFSKIEKMAQKNDWEITKDVNLTLLSFLKINMYKDIENNKDLLVSNPIVKALCGDKSEIGLIPTELSNFNHDKNTRPIDTYQVLDADSSQQDAILLAKRGISFVLQGPPGTGKSQTIANIISESLSDGKKVLFVSEKMAALEVVKKRLTSCGIDDFCLTLHNYKENKKAILEQLSKTLNKEKIKLREEVAYKLSLLEEKRRILNEYSEQLHTKCTPLNISIYEANGRLAKLSNTEEVVFSINDVKNTNIELLNKYKYLLGEFSKTVGKSRTHYSENPWYGCNIQAVTHEFRHDSEVKLKKLIRNFNNIINSYESIKNKTGLDIILTINNLPILYKLLNLLSTTPKIPQKWFNEDIDILKSTANKNFELVSELNLKSKDLFERYEKEILELDASNIRLVMECNLIDLKELLNKNVYLNDKDIIENSELILNECRKINEFLVDIGTSSRDVFNTLDIDKNYTLNSVIEIEKLIEIIINNPQPINKWFECVSMADIDEFLKSAISHQKNLDSNLQKIKDSYQEKVLGIDYKILNTRFANSYLQVLNTISRFFGFKNVLEVPKQKINIFVNTYIPDVDKYFSIIKESIEITKELEETIGIKPILTINELISLYKMLDIVINNHKPRLAWFDEGKSFAINKVINDTKNTQREIKKETENLLMHYKKDILDIDYKGMSFRFKSNYNSIFKYLNKSYITDKKVIKALIKDNSIKLTDDDILILLNKIESIKEKEQLLIDNKPIVNEMLGDLYMDEYTDWDVVQKSIENFKNIKQYFDGNIIPDKLRKILLENNMERVIRQYSTISKIGDTKLIEFLKSIFGKEVCDIELQELLKEIDNTINISTKIKNDFEDICQYLINIDEVDKITVNHITDLLSTIKQIIEEREWFEGKSKELIEKFSTYYKGEATNWKDIECRICDVKKIKSYFDNNNVPEKLVKYLTSTTKDHEWLLNFKNQISNINSNNILNRIDKLIDSENNHKIEFEKLIAKLDSIEKMTIKLNNEYLKLLNVSKLHNTYETIIEDIKILNRVQEIESYFRNSFDELKFLYEYRLEGINTNWENVISDLEFVHKLKSYCEEHPLSSQFIREVSDDDSISQWAIKYCKKLKEEKEIENNFNWYHSIFDNGKEFYSTSIYNLLDKVEQSISNISELEEWIDFRSIREQCREIGLTEFVDKVEKIGIHQDIIVDTFLKRFYILWLDATIPLFPSVQSFRCRSHQAIIQEFRNLDKIQFELTQLRILEKLISRLPDLDVATSSVDEVGILKREVSKQRKIMPLRKLFRAIPNLLTALKPCLMMSPLSVSLFLQSEGYKFDTVIFDEASQVCTEDAIGAIMRGKQVIIAGDSKQLPPTSFFAASLNESDFDNEDVDTSDIGAYDSVLDEAVNSIPERTLKWHYRSRHEDLIAFSNAKIYNNELITFPSNMEKVPDNGVEYIYVEDGVYDRGGKKNNLNEARRVAELVFQHIEKYPSRSLGVVTFSEAQQHAVDNAVRELRLSNTKYEKFFAEDVEDAFFIKNIENVQGDERDTIIFSIGYAKDHNGVMYMNFGPLSREGGHRRLNVAITRAIFNVKLVGSISPTDINIETTKSEGIKLLRKYIEFAINGSFILKNELEFSKSIDVESPFEESVYDFIVKNGYEVQTQVGCSGYRIDMAVKHPTYSGVFVIGIECDGATYHSARTARERDRLRQTVLENIGWIIYRVWSTDWIKDPQTEGAKLLEAINTAIANYEIENLNFNSEKNDEIEEERDLIKQKYISVESKKTENKVDPNNPYMFEYYEETDVYEVTRGTDDAEYLANVINYVVEKESPIHSELLAKRVATLFGNQKATIKVRNSIEYVLNQGFSNSVVIKDDFCWNKNANEIKVKIPRPYGDIRPINYISTEEICEAMNVIVKKSFGISKSDLITTTARMYGYNRTGTNIMESMDKALFKLLESKKLREIDGKIVV